MAEFGLSKLLGSIFFKLTLSLVFILSLFEPGNEEAFKLVANSIALKYKIQIFFFVTSGVVIIFLILQKITKRELDMVQLELEKEKLRTEKLLNDLRELEIKEKSTPE